jgi:hypothetical protein
MLPDQLRALLLRQIRLLIFKGIESRLDGVSPYRFGGFRLGLGLAGGAQLEGEGLGFFQPFN